MRDVRKERLGTLAFITGAVALLELRQYIVHFPLLTSDINNDYQWRKRVPIKIPVIGVKQNVIIFVFLYRHQR